MVTFIIKSSLRDSGQELIVADRELCFYYPLVLVATIFYGSKKDRQDQRVSIKNVSDLEFKAISGLLQNR